MTSCTSKFSTTEPLPHNNLSSVCKKSTLHVPHCVTNDPTSPLNGQLSPTCVTPKENDMSHNNQPKHTPHVPNDPELDPSSSYYSSLESLESSDYGYSK